MTYIAVVLILCIGLAACVAACVAARYYAARAASAPASTRSAVRGGARSSAAARSSADRSSADRSSAACAPEPTGPAHEDLNAAIDASRSGCALCAADHVAPEHASVDRAAIDAAVAAFDATKANPPGAPIVVLPPARPAGPDEALPSAATGAVALNAGLNAAHPVVCVTKSGDAVTVYSAARELVDAVGRLEAGDRVRVAAEMTHAFCAQAGAPWFGCETVAAICAQYRRAGLVISHYGAPATPAGRAGRAARAAYTAPWTRIEPDFMRNPEIRKLTTYTYAPPLDEGEAARLIAAGAAAPAWSRTPPPDCDDGQVPSKYTPDRDMMTPSAATLAPPFGADARRISNIEWIAGATRRDGAAAKVIAAEAAAAARRGDTAEYVEAHRALGRALPGALERVRAAEARLGIPEPGAKGARATHSVFYLGLFENSETAAARVHWTGWNPPGLYAAALARAASGEGAARERATEAMKSSMFPVNAQTFTRTYADVAALPPGARGLAALPRPGEWVAVLRTSFASERPRVGIIITPFGATVFWPARWLVAAVAPTPRPSAHPEQDTLTYLGAPEREAAAGAAAYALAAAVVPRYATGGLTAHDYSAACARAGLVAFFVGDDVLEGARAPPGADVYEQGELDAARRAYAYA